MYVMVVYHADFRCPAFGMIPMARRDRLQHCQQARHRPVVTAGGAPRWLGAWGLMGG